MRKNISYKNRRKIIKKNKLQKKYGGSSKGGEIDTEKEAVNQAATAIQVATQATTATQAVPKVIITKPEENDNDANSSTETGDIDIEYMQKSPMMKLADHLLYSLYTLAGVFIYFPSYFANLPEDNLENIIPEKGGCKILFGDELTCKKKLKCFFKNCSMTDDPQTWANERTKLKNTSKKGKVLKGGRRLHKQYSMKKKKNYFKYIPHKIQQMMKQKQKKEIKEYYQLYKSVNSKKKKQKGGIFTQENQIVLNVLPPNMPLDDRVFIENELRKKSLSTNEIQRIYNGKEADVIKQLKGTSNGSIHIVEKEKGKEASKNLDEKTCTNKVLGKDGKFKSNHTFCNGNSPIDYNKNEVSKKFLSKTLFGRNQEERLKETVQSTVTNFRTVFGIGRNVGYETNLSREHSSSLANEEIIEDFIRSHYDKKSVYRMLIIYKMLDKIFDTTITDSDIKQYGENLPIEDYNVEVMFPWKLKNNKQSLNPEEKQKCLLTHLTKANLGDDYKSKDLYKKCFICKNCTLANTSFKVWDRLFSNLFKSSKQNFIDITHDLFELMKKNFEFKLLPIKQYYLLSLLSMNMVNSLMEFKDLKPRVTVESEGHNKTVYSFRDLILGIPQIELMIEPTSTIKDQLYETYMIMKAMNFEDILYHTTFEFMFKKLKQIHNDDGTRIHKMKNLVQENCRIYYGRQLYYPFMDSNEINLEDLKQTNLLTSQTLQEMFENPQSSTREEINKEIETVIESKNPLFRIVLDRAKFDKVDEYNDEGKELISKLNQHD